MDAGRLNCAGAVLSGRGCGQMDTYTDGWMDGGVDLCLVNYLAILSYMYIWTYLQYTNTTEAEVSLDFSYRLHRF